MTGLNSRVLCPHDIGSCPKLLLQRQNLLLSGEEGLLGLAGTRVHRGLSAGPWKTGMFSYQLTEWKNQRMAFKEKGNLQLYLGSCQKQNTRALLARVYSPLREERPLVLLETQ